MTTESPKDALERRYMGRFQDIAAQYGVTVKYDRDRAARDIGLHLLSSTKSGNEDATGTLVWFQMKGVGAATLPRHAFDAAAHIDVKLKVKHLRLWHQMNGPTYLALYVESVDRFLVLNLAKYVREQFGRRIFTVSTKTLTVQVSTRSFLDDQAFALMLQNGTREEWMRVFMMSPSEAHLAERDYRLIWRLSTAEERRVEHQLAMTDWQSKCRGEIALMERPVGGTDDEWQSIRLHLSFMLSMADLEEAYPYLAFAPFDQERNDNIESWGNDDEDPEFTFSDGTVVYGTDAAGEYFAYELRPRLNSMGQVLAGMVRELIDAKLVDAPALDESEFLDGAPWNGRDV